MKIKSALFLLSILVLCISIQECKFSSSFLGLSAREIKSDVSGLINNGGVIKKTSVSNLIDNGNVLKKKASSTSNSTKKTETKATTKKAETKKAETKPTTKKAETKKAETKPTTKKAETKKTETKKAETKPTTKKAETKKNETKKAETKPSTKKTETKKAETKPSTKKTETKKAETKPSTKKTETKKAETKPSTKKTETKKAETKPSTKKTETKKTETKPSSKTSSVKTSAKKATTNALNKISKLSKSNVSKLSSNKVSKASANTPEKAASQANVSTGPINRSDCNEFLNAISDALGLIDCLINSFKAHIKLLKKWSSKKVPYKLFNNGKSIKVINSEYILTARSLEKKFSGVEVDRVNMCKNAAQIKIKLSFLREKLEEFDDLADDSSQTEQNTSLVETSSQNILAKFK